MTFSIAKTRFQRLLWLVQEIRNNPGQDLKTLCQRLGISRTQFYSDRAELMDLGFEFIYSKHERFRILEDKLSPVSHLTCAETMVIMHALTNLWASGDGYLMTQALEVGRKLVSGLKEPFRTQVRQSLDQLEIPEGYGCKAAVVKSLQEAIIQAERIEILYRTGIHRQPTWRTVDPIRLYFVFRALYLYAAVPHSTPSNKTYRVSRISDVRSTGMFFIQWDRKDDFNTELNNAFSAFLGKEIREVIIRFRGEASTYVKETLWHHSQVIEEPEPDTILFKVKVAEPKEVLWWALQFGDKAEILAPEELRLLAQETTSKMSRNYFR